MDSDRRRSWGRLAYLVLIVLCVPAAALAEGSSEPAAPSGGPPPGAPRSRLTLSGTYEAATYMQKNFFFGAAAADTISTGYVTDFDAFWIQRLGLTPRLILSDDLNFTLDLDLAHGVWGLDNSTPDRDRPGYTNLFDNKSDLFHLQVNRAYLAYRHAPTGTRWYVGEQSFGMGNLLVLDSYDLGIQVYKDLPDWNSSFGLGAAKVFEGTNGLTDTGPDSLPAYKPDGRDADLIFAEWRLGGSEEGLFLNPFFIWYLDRGNADGLTYLPNQEEILEARFQPNISSAKIFGTAARLRRGVFQLDAEVDFLSGKDRVPNLIVNGEPASPPLQITDANNGDLSGMNVYARAFFAWPRLELGGAVAMGSGDDDVFGGEGNFNHLRMLGRFYITELWEDGLALDRLGIAPDGLGNSFTRGYRGLENTRIFQGTAAFHLRPNLRLFAAYSFIRAAEALHPWSDQNGDGFITRDEYGPDVAAGVPYGSATDLGTEIDLRIDWTIDRSFILTLAGASFSPGVAGGYLINGTEKYQETATELRAGITVPIREFSLGG